jgi:hypothetical protein
MCRRRYLAQHTPSLLPDLVLAVAERFRRVPLNRSEISWLLTSAARNSPSVVGSSRIVLPSRKTGTVTWSGLSPRFLSDNRAIG